MRTLVLLLAATFTATTLSGQETSSTGNKTSGAAIFAGKGNCLTCHRVGDKGSRLGRNLTEIGTIRSPKELETSLVDPNAEILPEGRFYRVVTRDGATITGRLLNLDTYQVQMIDPKEQLRSFDKSELREHGFVKGSTMPSYRNKLSNDELADLIAYLGTLKGVTPQ